MHAKGEMDFSSEEEETRDGDVWRDAEKAERERERAERVTSSPRMTCWRSIFAAAVAVAAADAVAAAAAAFPIIAILRAVHHIF